MPIGSKHFAHGITVRETPMDDVLSDVLQRVRLRSCVYFESDFHAPWGMRIDRGSFAQFHVVVHGTCSLIYAGHTHTLSTGDIILFPRGTAHALADMPGRELVPGPTVVEAVQSERPPFPEGGPVTRLLCGHFEFDRAVRHPLFDGLPELILVPAFNMAAPGTFNSVLPVLVGEVRNSQPGSTTVVERLAEVLLIQVFRSYLADRGRDAGFLAAAADRRLSRALKLMHTRAEDRLTLEMIAKAAGMSRSALALRFKEVLDMTPMAYLTRWRMTLARDYLRLSDFSSAEIARRVGYESDIAFSRAFKRVFGQSPALYRRSI